MKSLKDYASEIQKCSKCGLCQSVCPVYKVTGNDCAVSRGKFVMLDGVLKGELKLGKNIEKYLDQCLKCGKCTDFCPSGIDVCDILYAAKAECFKFSIPLTPAPLPLREEGAQLLYFSGCFNRVLRKHPLKKLAAAEDPGFGCCGFPYLSAGDVKRFGKCVEHNKNLAGNKLVITDCASCAHMLKKCGINAVNAAEYLESPPAPPLTRGALPKVTFHKPCHMENTDFLKPLLRNAEYIEMKDFDACCGFGGEFALKNNKISREIAKQKAENILATGADVVLTACPGCILGLHQGLFGRKAPKIMNIVDFLATTDSHPL
ncbi:MAG: (Fe-S)-binding protein [Heliobacteriaceae bacterium]|jgi:glycolate oxidase iron-sulfur subunit|nr:(Fe-S)-binding protein [Heliobacteriaceae bacterium]